MGKYRFISERKDEILQGKTLTYVADKILFCNYPYLTKILKGKETCSCKFAQRIVALLDSSARFEDYFVEDKER